MDKGETVVVEEFDEDDTQQSGGEDGLDGEDGLGDKDQLDGKAKYEVIKARLGGKEYTDDKDKTE
ncbi:hypothetical protein PGT21_014568 [Puccinia graminis f. sp. tritici]|uniref:Uncharacterized protein n=2 Tax=Puccinia graminis f. sp. tritici TaxID=56615 RepID=H6QSI3_PUCGT|nr:uncharacterized protein PGTG_21796 [Puccinia graminis f. sp. tritici CRL 75-36-700-3]EHS63720.1 hypothetical protein PGTG_21796 [Puccinia graminis f. sp. tritici CRL 75-36-700-3]KAA1111881.1 hypothetical protein PGT21_014568 [Puccinia graminis f. sp. tritici]